jgi:hypothetical protein
MPAPRTLAVPRDTAAPRRKTRITPSIACNETGSRLRRIANRFYPERSDRSDDRSRIVRPTEIDDETYSLYFDARHENGAAAPIFLRSDLRCLTRNMAGVT